MKELGVTPKHFTTEMAVLLLDPHKLPPLYAPVILKNRKKVGTITDIIGPVKSPWCVVKLKKQYITLSEGEKLYFIPESQKKQRGSKKRTDYSRKQRRSSKKVKSASTKKNNHRSRESTNPRYRRS